MRTNGAGGIVSRRQRSLNTPASALLNEKYVVVLSPGRSVPVVCFESGVVRISACDVVSF